MNRTRAQHLVLVNWKGVFYERYALDEAVTALEGLNGAGKTTVMIAAYIVLLPDMTRLRFTNIGESGVSPADKGIWGRLGDDDGRPSYAAIDFRLPDGRRLVAGVHLERKGDTGEPSPFIISGLSDSVKLQDLFLLSQGGMEAVPELHELRENSVRLGGRLEELNALKYFGRLFDEGVTPLRLGTDEERNKLNDMLRTSMTGGISRALTSELRGFLLREETGLASTLQRMRQNLDACRRTRTEVQESQRLEREIGGVYEAGNAMFISAVAATRERAEDHTRRVQDAQSVRDAAAEESATKSAAHEQVAQLIEETEAEIGRSEQQLEAARKAAALLDAAVLASAEVVRFEGETEQASGVEEETAGVRRLAEAAKVARNDELKRAQEGQKLAAGGLADLQNGLDELHRRANLHRQVMGQLAEARRTLPTLDAAAVDPAIEAATAQLAEIDAARRELSRRSSDAATHREEYSRAASALREILQSDTPAEVASATATATLGNQRELLVRGETAPRLKVQAREARKDAQRQLVARERAVSVLGSAIPAGAEAADFIKKLLRDVESEHKGLVDEAAAAASGVEEAKRTKGELGRRLEALHERAQLWRELASIAARLGEHRGAPVSGRDDLDVVRADLYAALSASKRHEEALTEEREELTRQARELLSMGGPFDPDLLKLRDALGADLLAGRFEELSVEEAPLVEARLGALAQALIVDEPRTVGGRLRDRGAVETVLLVAPDFELDKTFGGLSEDGQDALVVGGGVVRVSRVPSRPRLGRKAREARASELRTRVIDLDVAVEDERAKQPKLESLKEGADALLAGIGPWSDGDPQCESASVLRDIEACERKARELQTELAANKVVQEVLRERVEGLRGLLTDAHLLDPPDRGPMADELEREHAAAIDAVSETRRCRASREILEASIAALRQAPLSATDLAVIAAKLESLKHERDALFSALEAMTFVAEHREALAWTDAARVLADKQELKPALIMQLERAEAAVQEAERLVDDAENLRVTATQRWQDADGKARALRQQLEAARTRVIEIGVLDATPEAAAAAHERAGEVDRALRVLSKGLGDAREAVGRLRSEKETAEAKETNAEQVLAAEKGDAVPAMERWDRLQMLLAQNSLDARSAAGDEPGARGHVNRVQEARRQGTALVERLRTARGGEELVPVVADALDKKNEVGFGDVILSAWIKVRVWLRQRLPAQIADVVDPSAALARLRSHLATLDDRLVRQEADLRGASEDVARGIDVQVRKARGKVDRLNKSLDGLSFGTVHAIRVRMEHDEKMRGVLNALRVGEAEGLLFAAGMPIEEALEEIFRRYGGGGRPGGHRLLDYREYVQLCVDVKRADVSDWEPVNPTQLSTGEAIGVGAALMMVILSEWERDANLLRGKRAHGSLRFLFLDEANRLSKDNLKILFDLCRVLELQLLIAAPEVAEAEGNTTYRLVREIVGGHHVVRAFGRRVEKET